MHGQCQSSELSPVSKGTRGIDQEFARVARSWATFSLNSEQKKGDDGERLPVGPRERFIHRLEQLTNESHRLRRGYLPSRRSITVNPE